MNVRELMAKRAALIGQARALLDEADRMGRGLIAEEETQYRESMAQADALESDIRRRQDLERREAELVATTHSAGRGAGADDQRQRDEVRAIALFVRRGDPAGLLDLRAASNATDMNITTPADGGYAVPTGHYAGIIAKRNEGALFQPLGVMPIPGRGTTVNVPFDSAGANEFVSTNEVATFDKDAPVLGQAAMTLVKFTKQVQLSQELLEDEDSALVAFLDDYVGRALALTHNKALVTEALANGTSVTLGAAAAATAGDPETLVFNLEAGYDDNAVFVMRRATEGTYRKLTGNPFLYQPTPAGMRRVLSDHPVYNSAYLAAIGAGNKSIAFGDFSYMGMRQGQLTFLRDPYSDAKTGQINLWYYARIVYKVLNASAILYGKHPTA